MQLAVGVSVRNFAKVTCSQHYAHTAGAEKDADTEAEAAQKGDMLFTDDRLSGYRSIVHKTYFVLEYVVRAFSFAANYSSQECY